MYPEILASSRFLSASARASARFCLSSSRASWLPKSQGYGLGFRILSFECELLLVFVSGSFFRLTIQAERAVLGSGFWVQVYGFGCGPRLGIFTLRVPQHSPAPKATPTQGRRPFDFTTEILKLWHGFSLGEALSRLQCLDTFAFKWLQKGRKWIQAQLGSHIPVKSMGRIKV